MSERFRRTLTIAAALTALAGGGAAIAGATGGGEDESDDDIEAAERVTGAAAEEAAAAALDVTGGGEVLEVERADEGVEGFEVEVAEPDGAVVEVNLDRDLDVVSTESDD